MEMFGDGTSVEIGFIECSSRKLQWGAAGMAGRGMACADACRVPSAELVPEQLAPSPPMASPRLHAGSSVSREMRTARDFAGHGVAIGMLSHCVAAPLVGEGRLPDGALGDWRRCRT